jgi:hypothetical protein
MLHHSMSMNKSCLFLIAAVLSCTTIPRAKGLSGSSDFEE